AAANTIMGPAEARKPVDRRRRPRFQRRFPAALRRRREDLARLHERCLSARQTPGALRVPDSRNLSAPRHPAVFARAEVMAQYQAWPDDASQYLLEGRGSRRLQARILEIRLAASGSRRDRISDQFDSGGPPFDSLRACR